MVAKAQKSEEWTRFVWRGTKSGTSRLKSLTHRSISTLTTTSKQDISEEKGVGNCTQQIRNSYLANNLSSKHGNSSGSIDTASSRERGAACQTSRVIIPPSKGIAYDRTHPSHAPGHLRNGISGDVDPG